MHTKILSSIAALALLSQAQSAYACGGCFSPPAADQKQTVVQNAERVLFMRDEKTKKSTVWIEVVYSGLAKDFGWVVPVPKLPVVGVGSRRVFDALDARMGFTIAQVYGEPENCRDANQGCDPAHANDWGGSADAAQGSFADASLGADASVPAPNGGVEILAHGTTGPYNYVVVKGTEASKLYDWLIANGYALPDKAKPIIDIHVKKGDVFLAIKLQNGQGVEAIRPVTLEMDDAEPCVPLRLTSIAATEDMAVTVTVAGNGRAVVKNHLDIQLNPLRLTVAPPSYPYQGCPAGAPVNATCATPGNYSQVLATAIDEAGGHAFVTESSLAGSALGKLGKDAPDLAPVKNAKTLLDFAQYLSNYQVKLDGEMADTMAGPISQIPLFKGVAPFDALAALKACGQFWQGMGGGTCKVGSGASAIVLEQAQLQAIKVDGVAVADLLQKAIIDPVFNVGAMLAASGRVTRLSLRISPSEMDRDPIFAYSATLPEIQPFIVAKVNQVCTDGWNNGPIKLRLSYDKLGSWVVDSVSIIDPVFKPLPAALAMFVQEETGKPTQIALADVGVVDLAIAGAVPGKPSLDAKISLKTPEAVKFPTSDPLQTKMGAWHIPNWGCTPLPGWEDGKLPPDGKTPPVDSGSSEKDAGSSPADTTSSSPDAAAPLTDTVSRGLSDIVAGAPVEVATSKTGCMAGSSAGSGGWLAFGVLLLALGLRRRFA